MRCDRDRDGVLTLNEMILDFNENKLRQLSGDMNRGVMALDVSGDGGRVRKNSKPLQMS